MDEKISPEEYLNTIEKIKQAILQLLPIAADSVEALSNNAENIEEFKSISSAYYSLLEKIQDGMRSTLHSLIYDGYLIGTPLGQKILLPVNNEQAQFEEEAKTLGTKPLR